MQTVVSKDGTKIAYDKLGSGPALIMVYGAFSYRNYPGAIKLAEKLSQHFTVYNYDRRGRGDSGDTAPYAVEREIEDIDALIKVAGGSAYVWGLSSGAALALKAAASGLSISKLAVHEPPFTVNDTDHRPPADFHAHLVKLIAEGKRGDAVKYYMVQGMGAPAFVTVIMRLIPGAWKKLSAVAPTLPYDAAILQGYLAGKPLSGKEWSGVTMPTTILYGTESPALFKNAAEAIADVLPNRPNIVARKGLGHTKRFLVDEFATAIIDSLK
ncbi:MAG TPA: alpha/beta hydrolase [Candidatus Saccharimonadales bacterium]